MAHAGQRYLDSSKWHMSHDGGADAAGPFAGSVRCASALASILRLLFVAPFACQFVGCIVHKTMRLIYIYKYTAARAAANALLRQ